MLLACSIVYVYFDVQLFTYVPHALYLCMLMDYVQETNSQQGEQSEGILPQQQKLAAAIARSDVVATMLAVLVGPDGSEGSVGRAPHTIQPYHTVISNRNAQAVHGPGTASAPASVWVAEQVHEQGGAAACLQRGGPGGARRRGGAGRAVHEVKSNGVGCSAPVAHTCLCGEQTLSELFGTR